MQNKMTRGELRVIADTDHVQCGDAATMANILLDLMGGWIKCSERMPDADGNYWGWWSQSKRQGPVWFIKSDL